MITDYNINGIYFVKITQKEKIAFLPWVEKHLIIGGFESHSRNREKRTASNALLIAFETAAFFVLSVMAQFWQMPIDEYILIH